MVRTGDDTELGNWSKSSASKLPISEMVSNMGDYGDMAYNLKYYEIVTDYPYVFTLERNLVGTEVIKIEGSDNTYLPYLIKDKNAARLDKGGPYIWVRWAKEGSSFPLDFDYLGFHSFDSEVMMLIPNPFK